jgi:hypothetical protein
VGVSSQAAHAIQQVLMAASVDPTERARAVGALRGSEVYATTWPTDPSALRSLLSSSGVRALTLFTDERQLDEAAGRYGWRGVDGHVPKRRMHISEAIGIARQQQVELVIIDLASQHALELDQGDMELLASAPSSRAPSYQGIAPVVSTPQHDASEVKRASTRPPVSVVSGEREHEPAAGSSALSPSSVNVDPAHQAVSATFSIAATVTMTGLASVPPDELAEALTLVLRDYPEVEWACFVGDADRAGERLLSVAMRIDRAFRRHLAELAEQLRRASAEHGFACEVLVLDTLEQMKLARSIGLPFYPWRKR